MLLLKSLSVYIMTFDEIELSFFQSIKLFTIHITRHVLMIKIPEL
jgi:hypothetical protein